MDKTKCAAQHFGMWAIEPQWFSEAVASVRAGTYPTVDAATRKKDADEPRLEVSGGIATITIVGHMTKGESSFGGASTVRTRQLVRDAVQAKSVEGIMLHIDSPGGTVAGTPELAEDVRAAATEKPLHAFIEDLGASAAFWVASQADRVSANAMAAVGSIGTVSVVEDSSEMAKNMGVKVHVVSTGAFKGAFMPGTQVTDAHLAHLQERVDDMNGHFLAAIRAGRGAKILDMDAVTDGRVFPAAKAMSLGLIDSVETIEQAHADLLSVVQARRDIAARSRTLRIAGAG